MKWYIRKYLRMQISRKRNIQIVVAFKLQSKVPYTEETEYMFIRLSNEANDKKFHIFSKDS